MTTRTEGHPGPNSDLVVLLVIGTPSFRNSISDDEYDNEGEGDIRAQARISSSYSLSRLGRFRNSIFDDEYDYEDD